MVKHEFIKLVCWLIFMLSSSGILQAASITLTADRDEVALNETLQLIFTVQGKQTGEPDFGPLNKDFQLLGTSSSSQISIINDNTTQSKSYTLRVAPRRTGELMIPAISFGGDQSNPSRIQVLERAVSAADTPGIEDTLKITASLDVPQPYVQQQVLLTVKIYRRINWQQAALSELDAGSSDLLVKQLGEDKQYRTTLEGKNWEVIERRFALFPQQSGELEISPFTLTVAVSDERQQNGRSSDPFDRFFSRHPTVQKTVRSDAIKLQVKPVIAGVRPWLAASDLKLQENWSVDTDKLRAGESVTRTIAIIADGVSIGQLPLLKPADVVDIKSYPDQPQTNEQATSHGLLSTSSQKFALIPARGGEFEIPPLEIKWWNVKKDKMETARLPGRTIKAGGAVAAAIEPKLPVQVEAVPLQENAKTEPSSLPSQTINTWLMLSSGVLLLLWLVTLYAWWSGRKTKPQISPEVARSQTSPTRRELLKMLGETVTEKNGSAARDVILQLAKQIWPDNPPASLGQMICFTEGPLADELNNLERSLYSADQINWDGDLIMRQLSALKTDENKVRHREMPLKPMYPGRDLSS